MIRLTCTQCRADLDIDDGFAGGVCRCQHCGTIQTVPKKSSRSAASAASKTLYTSPDRNKGASKSDLESLAAVVSSSGLSSKRLRQKTIGNPTSGSTKKLSPWWIVLAVATAIAIGVVLISLLVFRGNSTAAINASLQASATPSVTPITPEAPTNASPTFLGAAIAEPSVIYVLDRGSGASDWFSYLLEATFRSTATLGSDRRFQIIFWSNGDDEAAYPSGGPEFATTSNVSATRKALDSLEARGQSDAVAALTKAFKSQPTLIVLATGKGSQLDDSFAQQVLALRGNQKTRIDTFDIADSEIGVGLIHLSKETGGGATLISENELKTFAKQ